MSQSGLIEFELWSKGEWPRRDVVGESFYGEAIRSLFPKDLRDGGQELRLRAALVPDPANRHDPNAVKVVVEGRHIGHLSKDDAAVYQPVLMALVQRGLMPMTPAQVWGSEFESYVETDRRGRDIMHREFHASVSVTLDEWYLCVPLNEPPRAPHVMLPYGAALQVRKEENHQDALRRFVTRPGQCWAYGTLHAVTEQLTRGSRDLVEIRIDGRRVGELTPAMSAEYLPIIARLADDGLAAGARLIVKGNEIRTEVVLHAQRTHQLEDAWLASNLPKRSADAIRGVPLAARAGPGSTLPNVTIEPRSHRPIPLRPTRIVFAVPPGWPPAPPGWEPVAGWQPEPGWPVAPEDWEYWRTAP